MYYQLAQQEFESYLNGYDRENDRIKLKIIHTYGVVKQAEELAGRMHLSAEDTDLARLIALLHDIGRFEQLKRYDSFEPGTMDHAAYGVKVLFDEGMIRRFLPDDKWDSIIYTAIAHHSDYELPEISDPQTLLHAKLIRDEDKLDNCRVKLVDSTSTFINVSEEELGTQNITQKVYETVFKNKCILSADRVTQMDYWVSYIVYFFDINFKESFDIIAENDYLNRIIDRIPYSNPVTKEQMEKVKDIVVKLRYLECMDNIIYYDRWNNCPKDGFDYEGKVGAYLTELSNEKLTSKETKELVESLEGETAFDSDTDKGMVRYLIGKYKEAVQIPASLQGELNQANADGQLAWGKCYEADDFESFKPVLKKQFDLQEKIATAINPDEKPYQVLVNRFDKDYRLEEIDAILAKIKDAVCEILNAVREEQSKIDDSILECEADHDTVLRVVKKAQEILGLDKDKSTLFEIHHPVCVCTGPRDSRPSTNCDELIHAILAVVHETGHGLYNYNANDEVAESGLWGGIEGAMHESQSRFYENHVGRTREFWENLYPYLQKEVPKYKEISLDTFLAALNKVKPGLIRLKADELTNTLHIIIRYEIEKEYFDGKLTVDTIEEAWNRKYQEYLGFTPKNHQEGILQDVHWASGCVGYFQGYALGDAYAAQFAHKLLADCPDAFEKLGKGDSSVIGNWLKEHIHQYGQTYSAREMLKKATGEELNTGYYIEYLKEKYLH